MTNPTFDIAILGGGSAGVAAAVAAARVGARVCVVERSNQLGGNGSDGMVGTICGLSLCGDFAPSEPAYDNPGFATEFAREVAAKSGSKLETNERKLSYLPYRKGIFEEVCASIMTRLDGVSVFLGTAITDIERSGSSGEFLLRGRSSVGHSAEICARAIIDTSGNAVASALLQLPFQEPTPPQASALVFELSGLPPMDETSLGFFIRRTLREATLSGKLRESHSFLSVVPGSLRDGQILCKLGCAPLSTSASEDETRAALAEHGQGVAAIVSCLRAESPLLRNIQHSMTAPRLGVRGGRRGIGETTLDDESVLSSRTQIDGIALGFWPVELWSSPVRPELVLQQGAAYEIPVGSLCAKHAPGVYFAGRTLAATDRAIASARVIGTCLSTGYAAGRVAVGDLRGERRSAVVSKLREEQVDPFYTRRRTEG